MLPVLATLSEWHIILVLIIVFLLFGGKKLPELARGIGEAMKEFKKAQREINEDEHRPVTPPPPAAPAAHPELTTTASATPAPKPTDPKLN